MHNQPIYNGRIIFKNGTVSLHRDDSLSYEGYYYLEDLICWCIGIVSILYEVPESDVDLIVAQRGNKWEVQLLANNYLYWADDSDSAIEVIEGMLTKLIGK